MLQTAWPKPGKVVLGLLIANLAAYVLELLLLRANVSFVRELALSPDDVFERGFVWQVFTYMWLHAPEAPMHLIFNLLWLYFFGPPLERWWGPKRFSIAYLVFGLSGAALTLLFGLLSGVSILDPVLGGFSAKSHLGASGAIMGITIAWGLAFANQTMNFFLLGQMKGMTFVWIIVAIQVLYALSFDTTSSTSHFGGMIGAFVLCKGLWRPSRWSNLFRRFELARRRRRIESELRVIDGGKKTPSPKNGKGGNDLN